MRVLLLLIVTVLAAACAGSTGSGGQGASGSAEPSGSGSGATPGPGTPTSARPLSPTSAGEPAPGVGVPAGLLDQVKAQAAQRAGVDPSQVEIVSGTARTWNDGSLGCPEPGMNYIQVITEGYQIIARAGGRTYDFRTSAGTIKVCG